MKIAPLLRDFDNGNGICRYLQKNKCTIYSTRPQICNISAIYEKTFKSLITENKFIIANLQACIKISLQFQDEVSYRKLNDILSAMINMNCK
jgi:Fe-S-cluster containining protein